MHAYRSHTCGELRKSHVGETVKLSGWLHRRRDHGGVMFIDLRDHYGLTQIVFNPGSPGFGTVERLRAESVITLEGKVVARDESLVNPNLATGEIEVVAGEVTVQSEAAELPLPVFGEPDYPEEIRLTHRYLDLRRETLHKNMILRSQVIASLRRRMLEQGFTEYQTPILTASSPEGARDFLVPSRIHPASLLTGKARAAKCRTARSRGFLMLKRWRSTVPTSRTCATRSNWRMCPNSSRMTARRASVSSPRSLAAVDA